MFRLLALVLALVVCCPAVAVAQRGGQLVLRVVDEATGQPLAARLHLRDERGKPRRVKGQPFWHDHFVFAGEITLELPKGHYTFEIEHGPEYVRRDGYFDIVDGANDSKTVELKRFVDMAQEGWWSGDLALHRAPGDIRLIMEADDLRMAGVVTWRNGKSLWSTKPAPPDDWLSAGNDRYYSLWVGQDARMGGDFLFFGLRQPLPLPRDKKAESPTTLALVEAARKTPGVWVDAARADAWDLPLLVAAGAIDSISLADPLLERGGSKEDKRGRPSEKPRFDGPSAHGRFSQEVYFHLLNTGLRIPPSAASGSGDAANPAGYNRMYVHVGEGFSPQTWWENFRAGRVVVTNGPLLRPVVSGALPGYVFQSPDGEPVTLEISLNLATRDKIDYLEVIRDGQVALSVRLDEWAKEGKLPPVTFERSGWLAIRAATTVAETYRYALTAPYYVEIGEQPKRISRQSVQFFLDGLSARRAALERADDKSFDAAEAYWRRKLSEANAE